MPVRHGRMMVSPFTFYRGAAKIMAADLKDTPTAGLDVQLCGDAHLSNFGVFASPERTLAVRPERLRRDAAGAVRVRREAAWRRASRSRRATTASRKADARAATLASVTAYREAMAEFAEMRTLDIWYARLSEQELMTAIKNVRARHGTRGQARRRRRRLEKSAEKTGPEGAHPRQPAGAVEARRARRRPVPDRQPAADRRPAARPGAEHRHLGRRDRSA